jgi:L-arabonate dehydrase
VRDGDRITLDVPRRLLQLHVEDAALARRRAEWAAPSRKLRGGYETLYVDHVLQADKGADFDFLVGCRGHDVPRESH